MAMKSEIMTEAPGDVRHLDQYFGCWAIEESRGQLLMGTVRQMNWSQHREVVGAARAQGHKRDIGQYDVVDGVAMIPVVGVITKYGSSLSDLEYGTIGLRKAVRDAASDNGVRGVVLQFDTPGGTVAGTDDLARDIAAARKMKPVVGVIGDLCASAGYWLASQCGHVVCNPSGLVGSIGAYMVVEDCSEMAGKLGVRVHVIKSGEFKGAGVPGTVVTEAQIAEFQRTVDGLNDFFLRAVSKGRGLGLAAVKALADGRVHLAEGAKGLGLIDAVGDVEVGVRWINGQRTMDSGQRGKGAGSSGQWPVASGEFGAEYNSAIPGEEGEEEELEEEIEEVEADLNGGADGAVVVAAAADNLEDETMSEQKSEAVAATLAELKSGFPKAGAEWRETQMEAGATMAQATQAYVKLLEEQTAAAQADAATARAEAAEAVVKAGKSEGGTPTPHIGAPHVGTAGGTASADAGGDAVAEFDAAVDAEQERRKCTRAEAHKRVCSAQPELRKRMVAAHNGAHGRAAVAV